MGWKNPLTSAVNVDTRTAPTVAGVRMYEAPNPDTGQPRGVIELDDGIPGDTPATITQTADSNPHSIATPLGSVILDAGGYNGTPAPKLALNVEQNPAGVGPNVPVARLTSPGGFTVNGVPQVGAGWTVDASIGNYNAALLSGGWGTVPNGTLTLTVPVGQVCDVEFRAPWLSLVAGAEVALRLTVAGATVDGADYQAASAMRCPVRLAETITGTGNSVTVLVQAFLVAGASQSCSIQASAGAPVVLRHRLR